MAWGGDVEEGREGGVEEVVLRAGGKAAQPAGVRRGGVRGAEGAADVESVALAEVVGQAIELARGGARGDGVRGLGLDGAERRGGQHEAQGTPRPRAPTAHHGAARVEAKGMC